MNRYIKIGLIAVTAITIALFGYWKMSNSEVIEEQPMVEVEDDTPDYEEPILNFMRYVTEDKRDSVATLVRYSLRRPYPLKDITNEQEFVARYDELIDSVLKDSLATNPVNWSTMGWRGVMYGNGDIWFDYDGSLTAINHTTELSKRLYKDAVSLNLSTLHSSVIDRLTLTPILAFRSLDGDWIGRIDYVGDPESTIDVQMALYRRDSPLDGRPDYLIRGEEDIQGSAHNCYYYFQGEKASFIFENPFVYEVNKHPINLLIEYGECDVKDVDEFDKTYKCELIYWQDLF